MAFEPIKKGHKKDVNQEILKQVKSMKSSLVESENLDLICNIDENQNLKAVVPVYLNYFIHKNTNEIIDGHYTIFGKVVKVVDNEDDNINLFRNTAFKMFKQKALETLFETMNQGGDEQLEIPSIISKVTSPSILVIPIAIYS